MPESVKNVLLAALALVVLVVAVMSLQPSKAPATSVTVAPAAPAERPVRAVIFGDSIVDGTAASSKLLSMGNVACNDLGWACTQMGSGGTGYTTAGTLPGGKPYTARIGPELQGYTVDVLVLEGGSNDKAASQAVLAERAAQVLGLARRALPHAVIVFLGPYSPGPPDRITRQVNATIQQVAAAHRVPFIEQDQWLDVPNLASLISSDGFHPNTAGHAVLGHRFSKALRAAVPARLRASEITG